MLQRIILLLKKRNEIIIKTHKKAEIIFKTHFLFSSIIFTNDIEKFFYLFLANDEETMTNRKLIKIVYKIDMNKTLKINKIINRTLKQLVAIVTK